ncbi:DUF5681 domain-containing protein [Sphingomonas sp.]|uniref:DUF5681 domain-containing protein n=1 Tax=Sphingomonas sp. TaxID=28214 RepID=UPI00180DC831|nr:DUF5681 domain-containing protein [Sphingomonas sp.]MBA3511588.1 hypothetical protein [Sphingomonas sp.]
MSGDNDVGYRKPPMNHQFRPGKSGNPKGRPKRERIDVAERLSERIRFSINGKEESKTPFEAGLLSSVGRALKGDMRAARRFLGYCNSAGLFERAEPIDDHQYVLRIPKDWDDKEWMAMYEQFGAPPWKGERDGLPKTPPWAPIGGW